MSTLAGVDVPKEFLALVSRDALQSDAIGAMPVQVTIFDAVSRGLAYYSSASNSSSGSLPLTRKALSSRIQSTPSCLASARRT
jgi:hypothetical protein